MKKQFKKSNKFDVTSYYYNGVYYFPKDIIKTDKGYSVQVVYYRSKWRQDTVYITEDFKNTLTGLI